ncbi:MAG: hypothetical protein EA379_11640 [Phycisphaerales bacterium]|nr:MAG: hypothetical protein EA379_11640 [Phycisphaerales bacterium]
MHACTVLVATALLGASPFVRPQAELTPGYRAHETLQYQITQSSRVQRHTGEGVQTMVASGFDIHIEPGDGSRSTVVASYTSFAVEIDNGVEVIRYSSSDPEWSNRQGERLAPAVRAMLGTRLRMQVSRDGIASNLEMLDAPEFNDSRFIETIVRPEALRRAFTQIFTVRCDVDTPDIGHTWTSSESNPMGNGIWAVTSFESTLRDIENEKASIELRGEASLVHPDPGTELHQSIETRDIGGVLVWNIADGVLESARTHSDFDVVTPRGGLAPDRTRLRQASVIQRTR